jgi:hypothetical protein
MGGVGKAIGSRECAPDGRRHVPTAQSVCAMVARRFRALPHSAV